MTIKYQPTGETVLMETGEVVSGVTDQEGQIVLELLDPPYTGIKFTYSGVKVEPIKGKDQAKMSFEYNLLPEFENKIKDKHKFEQYLGVLLQQVLEEMVAKQEVVYRGGTNERAV